MNKLWAGLASFSDGLIKAEAMKWLRPIFSHLSLRALKRAIEEDIDILSYVWASMPEEAKHEAREEAGGWAGVIRSITENQALRWLNDEFPQHIALIKGHPKGLAWVSLLLASMKRGLLEP